MSDKKDRLRHHALEAATRDVGAMDASIARLHADIMKQAAAYSHIDSALLEKINQASAGAAAMPQLPEDVFRQAKEANRAFDSLKGHLEASQAFKAAQQFADESAKIAASVSSYAASSRLALESANAISSFDRINSALFEAEKRALRGLMQTRDAFEGASDAALRGLSCDTVGLMETVACQIEAARTPELALDWHEQYAEHAEEEASSHGARVALLPVPDSFTPYELDEILRWCNDYGVPCSCDCLDQTKPGEDHHVHVWLAELPMATLQAESPEHTSLSVVFQCAECGRQVFHGMWPELQQVQHGLTVVGGEDRHDE